MNSCVDTQIKAAYEVSGLTPEQIAENEGFSEVAVKAKLMQVSSVYRKACGHEPTDESDLNFSDAQLKDANEIIYNNMLYAKLPDGSPDYRTKQKAAEYIRDDKKGRKEIIRAVQNNTFNLLEVVNGALSKARLQASAMRKQVEDKQTIEA